MTESEAWLSLAERLDSDEPFAEIGLCNAISSLQWRELIHWQTADTMADRLKLFRNGESIWYWPMDTERDARMLRATACGFLAAMAEEDT